MSALLLLNLLGVSALWLRHPPESAGHAMLASLVADVGTAVPAAALVLFLRPDEPVYAEALCAELDKMGLSLLVFGVVTSTDSNVPTCRAIKWITVRFDGGRLRNRFGELAEWGRWFALASDGRVVESGDISQGGLFGGALALFGPELPKVALAREYRALGDFIAAEQPEAATTLMVRYADTSCAIASRIRAFVVSGAYLTRPRIVVPIAWANDDKEEFSRAFQLPFETTRLSPTADAQWEHIALLFGSDNANGILAAGGPAGTDILGVEPESLSALLRRQETRK